MRNCDKFEFEVAGDDGERRSRSGAGEEEKLDVLRYGLLIDCKTDNKPTSKQLTVKLDQWLNAVRHARWEGFCPAIAFQLTGHKLALTDLEDLFAIARENIELRRDIERLRKRIRKLKNARKNGS